MDGVVSTLIVLWVLSLIGYLALMDRLARVVNAVEDQAKLLARIEEHLLMIVPGKRSEK